jgi:hypothetical protein
VNETCGLCGEGPSRSGRYGAFFGGRSGDVDLHHDFERIEVGRRANGTPIKVTCYEAWTVYGLRRIARGVYGSDQAPEKVINLRPEDVEPIRALIAELRAERDCGA